MTQTNSPFPPAAAGVPANQGQSFQDCEGRIWQLRFTIGRVREIRDATNVDFANLEDGRVFLQLRNDPERFAQVLWLLIDKQAAARQPTVSPTEFIEALDGDALDAAGRAIIEAIISFTPAPKRGALQTAIRDQLEAHAKAMETIREWCEESGRQLVDDAVAATRQALETSGRESPS
jgi:hypothetical protein